MADETEELVLDEPEGEQEQQEAPEGEEAEQEGDDLSIEIEGEDGEDDTPLVKHLRNQLREANKRAADTHKPAPTLEELGPEPTLEDFEYDGEAYTAAVKKWTAATLRAEQAQQQQQQASTEQARTFDAARVKYHAAAQTKGIDIADAEAKVLDALGNEWLGAIVMHSKSPEVIVAALGKYPTKLHEIAAEPDGVKKMRMLWELEGKVMVKRKGPPPADRANTLSGSAAPSTSIDKVAERLLAEAQRGGSMDKYHAHMKAKRAA